jgi:hypothetical protein
MGCKTDATTTMQHNGKHVSMATDNDNMVLAMRYVPRLYTKAKIEKVSW